MERCKFNRRGEVTSRSYTSIGGNTAQIEYIQIYGDFWKGKSNIIIFEKWGDAKFKYRNRQFKCRGIMWTQLERTKKMIAKIYPKPIKNG